jgi:hypothetical protein
MKMLLFARVVMVVGFLAGLCFGIAEAPMWVVCFVCAGWCYYVGTHYLGMSGLWD